MLILLLITYELGFSLNLAGLLYIDKRSVTTFEVYLIPLCYMLNSLVLYFFIFEVDRIRLQITEDDILKFKNKYQIRRAQLLVVILSVVSQAICVVILNYQKNVDQHTLSELSVLILSVSSTFIKILTDAFVYWIAIRGIWFLFREYEDRRNVDSISQSNTVPQIKQISILKWKVLISFVIIMAFIETLIVILIRISFNFASREFHLLLVIFGALFYSPLNKVT